MKPIVIRGEAWEGSNFRILADPVDLDGVLLVHDASYSYSIDVFDLSSSTATYTNAAPGNLLESSAQTGTEWDLSDAGYTFDYEWDASLATLEGGKTYRFEFEIDTSGGSPDIGIVPVVAEIKIRSRSNV